MLAVFDPVRYHLKILRKEGCPRLVSGYRETQPGEVLEAMEHKEWKIPAAG